MNGTEIHGTGAGTGSLRSYAIGYILAVVLTAVAFGLVMTETVSHATAFYAISGVAVVQILVHLHYFLHLDTSSSKRWNVLALLFTILIMAIFVAGSIWIMASLHPRMM
jgi:cytochrome o ubiquinol oxidase subunit IV